MTLSFLASKEAEILVYLLTAVSNKKYFSGESEVEINDSVRGKNVYIGTENILLLLEGDKKTKFRIFYDKFLRICLFIVKW